MQNQAAILLKVVRAESDEPDESDDASKTSFWDYDKLRPLSPKQQQGQQNAYEIRIEFESLNEEVEEVKNETEGKSAVWWAAVAILVNLIIAAVVVGMIALAVKWVLA